MYINKQTRDGYVLVTFSRYPCYATSIDLDNHIDIIKKYEDELKKCVTNEDVNDVAKAVYAEVLLVNTYKQDILNYIQRNS